MNILEARRRLLDGEIKKRTAEGENISVRSVSRMRPALTLYGKSEQRTTTGAQLYNESDESIYLNGYYVNNNNIFTPASNNYGFCFMLPIGDYVYTQIGVNTDVQICAFSEFPQSGATAVWKENPMVPEGQIKVEFNVSESAQYIFVKYTHSEAEAIKSPEEVRKSIMLNSGTTALPWEPYTGGAPSPSPDYPQEIKSVGDSGSINVSLSDGGSQSQTLPVQTPNGLPGIPVSSGGNYTDASGQQWICDEVDFERGVYVQRIIRYTGPFYKRYWAQTDSWFVIAISLANIPKPSYRGFCNISGYYMGSWDNLGNSHWFLQTGGQQIVIHLGDTYNTEEAVEQFIEKNGIVVYYAAETPIETPLSPSELAAYSALRTYSPTTVVSNDAGAWMKLGYKTKKSLEVTD